MNDSNVRTTATNLIIRGDADRRRELRFVKRSNGTIKVNWSGYVPIETTESARCDLGHLHRVIKEKHFVWEQLELSWDEVREMLSFFSDRSYVRMKKSYKYSDLMEKRG